MRQLIFFTLLVLFTFCSCTTEIKQIETPHKVEIPIASSMVLFQTSEDGFQRDALPINYVNSFYARFTGNRNDKVEYIDRFLPVAISMEQKYSIPVAFKLAQAILESGSDSKKCLESNNHFGIKCKDESYGENGCKDGFATYLSPWESWNSHSRFLTERKYYSHIKDICNGDSDCWAKKVGPIYCPDEGYVEALLAVMDSYGLRKYDVFSYDEKYNLPTRINVSPSDINSGNFLPVGNYTYLLNPSHGEDTKGKMKTFETPLKNGEYSIYEWILNRRVSKRLEMRCKELNIPYRVLVNEDKDISRTERVRRSNECEQSIGKTILITIDHNAAPFDNSNEPSISDEYDEPKEVIANGKGLQVASGMEAYHYANNGRTKHFLDVLGMNIDKRLPGWYSRGTKTARFQTIMETNMPSVTLECGFFDNKAEANFLNSDVFLIKLTEGIIETFCVFNGVQYEPSALLK
jgi:N-acetylmuramoyl-L-alanine amidase